ncbi:uncharacterized protein G2W53_006107 [Senna tora]|uniref:Uncharacterized protein n=1 Tax=Senna tora TaxID=362788 RepID=A0A834X401_9FABA|nr:uncharacterized protein G2W53_006102 [Senna tora]KAF7837625.1 uncharacterized protein G2W53_006107 [Senna tora]
MGSQSVVLWNKLPLPMPLKPPAAMMAASYAPPLFRWRTSTTTASATSAVLISKPVTIISIPLPSTHSSTSVSATPPIQPVKNLGFRPTPQLGLLSLLFPLSMAFAAFFSMAVVSIPTMIAFGRLGASMKKLSEVASEEIPGTLSSLKLSSMELNDLTQQLNNLRFLGANDWLSLVRLVRSSGMLLSRVTLDDDTKDLFSEFAGSIFQSLTSHTCSRIEGGFCIDQVTELGASEMVDAKLNSGDSLEASSHVGSHAGESFSYQSRNPSM